LFNSLPEFRPVWDLAGQEPERGLTNPNEVEGVRAPTTKVGKTDVQK